MQRVELRGHSRLWKWRFRKEKALLRAYLGRRILDVEHVGSTAVPGMVAKPIVDILVLVPDFQRAYEYVGWIERLGYEYKGENGESRQYSFAKGTPTRYLLYMQERHADTRERLAFRDCLRGNRDIAARYAHLKRALAVRHADDLRAYREGKREFIDRVIRSECAKSGVVALPEES